MDFKPYIWCDGKEPKGIDIEIVTEMFSRIDRPFTIECLPWKRALNYIKSGDADALFSAYRTKEREQFAIFLSSPVHKTTFSAFVRSGEALAYSSTEDLYGKHVGVNLGYSINPEFDAAKANKKFNVSESRTTDIGIRMLIKGRVDTYINSRDVVLFTAREMGVEGLITPLPKPMHDPRPAFIMFSKSAPIKDKEQLIEALNQSLAKMWEDGTIKHIIDSFTKPQQEHGLGHL